jgi:protein tyrosine phosphatase (PTP) superfamily phosphohydrolase (DUF442 family)
MTMYTDLDISPITEHLYISAWLKGDHAEEIRSSDIRLILSMHWIKPSRKLQVDPVKLLWLPTIDNPLFPMPIWSLNRGVSAALPIIAEGNGVLVHCRAGRHRSVAMACCVLIGLGMKADDTMQLVKKQRTIADPDAWYIKSRIYKFERFWKSGD